MREAPAPDVGRVVEECPAIRRELDVVQVVRRRRPRALRRAEHKRLLGLVIIVVWQRERVMRAAVDLRERGPVPKRERRVGEDSDAAGRTKPSNSWCASAWSAADCVSVWNARVAASGSRTWRAAATSSCRLDWLR